MKLRPLRRSLVRNAWPVLLAVAVFGCSRLPTAPETPGTGNRTAEPSGLISGLLEPLEPAPIIPDTLIRWDDVDGGEGGKVRAGHIEVEVPRGAYEGVAEIRITVPNEDSLRCHLEIYPSSKNHFTKPVKVKFDVRNVDPADLGVGPLETLGVYWLDETTGRWVQIAADYDEGGKITAELNHFSQYKVAKASWNKASW